MQFAICASSVSSSSPSGIALEADRGQLRAQFPDGRVTDIPYDTFLGPDSAPDAALSMVEPLVAAMTAGQNAALVLLGPDVVGQQAFLQGTPDQAGLLLQAGEALFARVEQMSENGAVCIIELSCLEISTSESGTESLRDLQPGGFQTLAVAQDPLLPGTFNCEGLRRTAVESPKAMAGVIGAALRSYSDENQAKHFVATLHFESLSIGEDMDGPSEVKGKLQIVQLALAAPLLTSSAKGLAALGLSASADAGSSAIAKLLVDAFSSEGKVQCISHINPEASQCDHTWATLGVARRMLNLEPLDSPTPPTSAAAAAAAAADPPAVPVAAAAPAVEPEAPAQVTPPEERSFAPPARPTAQLPCAAYSNTLPGAPATSAPPPAVVDGARPPDGSGLTTEKLMAALGDSTRNMEDLRNDLLLQLQEDMAKTKQSSLENVIHLQKTIESSVEQVQGQKKVKSTQARAELETLEAKLQEAATAKRMAEVQATELRAQLAIVEERAKWLQEQEQDLVKSRPEIQQQRNQLHSKGSEQEGQIASAELELQRVRAMVEVRRTELTRLSEDVARQRDEMQSERAEHQRRAADLTKQRQDLEREVESLKHGGRCEQQKIAADWGQTVSELKQQVHRLEQVAQADEKELLQLQDIIAQTQASVNMQQQLMKGVQDEMDATHREYLEELEMFRDRERELVELLSQLHEEAQHIVVEQDAMGHEEYAALADIQAVVDRGNR